MFHVFGHNHNGYGRETIDGINFINCATCCDLYQPVNPPQYFELPIKSGNAGESGKDPKVLEEKLEEN